MDGRIASLLNIEQQLRSAANPAQLYYTIVNETYQCCPYDQAVLVIGDEESKPQVVAAADIPALDYTSPFVRWIEQLSNQLSREKSLNEALVLSAEELSGWVREQWSDMAADQLLVLPLSTQADGRGRLGLLLLFRASTWSTSEIQLLKHLAGTMGHALFALERRRLFQRFWRDITRRPVFVLSLVALIGVLWIPVRLSVLAPVEVVPKNPRVIAAPINGAIKQVAVLPNQRVSPDELLVEFEDLELANELDVAQQALQVAYAELRAAQQGGFYDPAEKARVAELESRVRLKLSEMEYARLRLEKARVMAPESGIAVIGDPKQWQGRPVSIGERIMLLADPKAVELQVMLPVKDAIALSDGAQLRVFFDNAPLNAYEAILRYAEYEPQMTPEEVLSYRLIADLEKPDETHPLPRMGTRGTAKVYGESTTLFFYLFRRPITSVRQWLGW